MSPEFSEEKKTSKAFGIVENRGRKPKSSLSLYMRKKKKQIMLEKTAEIKSTKRRGRPPSGSFKPEGKKREKDNHVSAGSEITLESNSSPEKPINGSDQLTSRPCIPRSQQELQRPKMPMNRTDREFCR